MILRRAALLPVLAGLLQLSCRVYCGCCWMPRPMVWGDADISWLCWLYCNALGRGLAAWGYRAIADAAAVLSIVSGFLIAMRRRHSISATVASGLLLLPVGALNLAAVAVVWRGKRARD